MIDHIGGGEGSPSRFSVLPNEDENSMEDDGTIGTSNAEEERREGRDEERGDELPTGIYEILALADIPV